MPLFLPKISVSGSFAGQKWETTTDSKLAKYYLENTLANKRTEPDLDRQIDQIEAEFGHRFPTQDVLETLTKRYATDFATLYLVNHLLKLPETQKCQSSFQNDLDLVLQAFEAQDFDAIYHPGYAAYRFLVVPAWDYRGDGIEMGTDFAAARQCLNQIGAENYLVEIEPVGTVDQNAAILADEILRHSCESDKDLVLVSGSSSGPIVAHALGEHLQEDQHKKVKAWVNTVGILKGTTFADFFMWFPIRWFTKLECKRRKWPYESIRSMSVQFRKERFQTVRLPQHLFTLNYLSIPLSGDISPFAGLVYRLLRPKGPNDGSTLILDSIAPNSA
ncbi:MAG: hypothetical protein ACO36I_13850, partial [Candidatus Latescibacterota bacterium]